MIRYSFPFLEYTTSQIFCILTSFGYDTVMSLFSKKLGIDLGTANILVFVPGRGIVLNEPSVVAVSEGVTSTERRAVIEAAIRAGAKNAYVVKEPILAAIGAGISIHEAMGHMIVDIGGGTKDVAVISLGGIVASTSVKCAGNKIDYAITDYIKKTFNLGIGDKTAEDIKVKIGSAIPLDEE